MLPEKLVQSSNTEGSLKIIIQNPNYLLYYILWYLQLNIKATWEGNTEY